MVAQGRKEPDIKALHIIEVADKVLSCRVRSASASGKLVTQLRDTNFCDVRSTVATGELVGQALAAREVAWKSQPCGEKVTSQEILEVHVVERIQEECCEDGGDSLGECACGARTR